MPEFNLPPGDYETRCCTCGKPYQYTLTYGCRPDWCATAPASITNAEWAEHKKECQRAQDQIEDLRQRVKRLEWETF